jgi:mannose-6-phosphate isomerase-like protein (cupin superfamily)
MASTDYRRVVAGIGADGRSCVVSDTGAEVLGLGTMTIAQMWTGRLDSKADSAASIEASTGPFRFEQLAEPAYAFMVAEYGPGLGRDDPGMHFTDTADHFHVISGEVVLVLEAEEVVLKAGDSGVCRGVVHGWRNDGETAAKVVTFVLPSTRAGQAGT